MEQEVIVRLTVNKDAQFVLHVLDAAGKVLLLKVTWDRKSSAAYAEEILEKRRAERADGSYRGALDGRDSTYHGGGDDR